MKRRDYKDVAAAMLGSASEQKKVSKVDMLYAAYSANSEGSALLMRIISAKLLKYDDDGGKGKRDRRQKRYHISREGQRFLRAYDTVMELLPKAL